MVLCSINVDEERCNTDSSPGVVRKLVFELFGFFAPIPSYNMLSRSRRRRRRRRRRTEKRRKRRRKKRRDCGN